MTKYLITYKDKGVTQRARVELQEGTDIMSFIMNKLPRNSRLLMKKVEEFSSQDLSFILIKG